MKKINEVKISSNELKSNDSRDKNIENLDIHADIKKKLKYFIEIKKIPNIIFHGVSGCGKNTLVNNFIHDIYHNEKEMIKN